MNKYETWHPAPENLRAHQWFLYPASVAPRAEVQVSRAAGCRDVGVLSPHHTRLCSLTARGTPKAGIRVSGSDRIHEGRSPGQGGMLGTRFGELYILFWLL